MNPRDVLGTVRVEDGRRWIDAAHDFQRADVLAVLEDRERPYHWISRPRGGSKTTDAGALALAWLLTGEPGARYYAAAGDRDQARLLLDAVERFIRLTPEARRSCACRGQPRGCTQHRSELDGAGGRRRDQLGAVAGWDRHR